MKIGIVIPALNEAQSVAAVIESALPIGQVIVVDDGSADATGSVAAAAGATVIRHEHNRGYDGALSSGYARAVELGCDVVVAIDADGQISVSDLEAVLMPIRRGQVDISIGVRERSARIGEALFSAYAKFRFGVPDILCGLKAFTAEVYHKHGDLTRTDSINTALFVAALRDGARFTTVPVAIAPRDGESRFGSGLRANWQILKVLFVTVLRDCRAG